jgi:hypothetical protein
LLFKHFIGSCLEEPFFNLFIHYLFIKKINMPRIKDSLGEPQKEIIMYQGTVESLANNTLTADYFEFLKKILNEGYVLKFKNDHETDSITVINDVNHLKNYINNNQGYDFLA